MDQILTHAGTTTANMNYLPFSTTFEADSTTTTLILASRQSGFNGVYFDTVSVVPEPSTSLMLAIGASVHTRLRLANSPAPCRGKSNAPAGRAVPESGLNR